GGGWEGGGGGGFIMTWWNTPATLCDAIILRSCCNANTHCYNGARLHACVNSGAPFLPSRSVRCHSTPSVSDAAASEAMTPRPRQRRDSAGRSLSSPRVTPPCPDRLHPGPAHTPAVPAPAG